MSGDDPMVSYTIREIIDQINGKLDLLPGLAHQINAAENRAVEDRAAIRALETRVDVLEQVKDQTSAWTLFRERAWARVLGIATLVGVVVGVAAALTRLLAGS